MIISMLLLKIPLKKGVDSLILSVVEGKAGGFKKLGHT